MILLPNDLGEDCVVIDAGRTVRPSRLRLANHRLAGDRIYKSDPGQWRWNSTSGYADLHRATIYVHGRDPLRHIVII